MSKNTYYEGLWSRENGWFASHVFSRKALSKFIGDYDDMGMRLIMTPNKYKASEEDKRPSYVFTFIPAKPINGEHIDKLPVVDMKRMFSSTIRALYRIVYECVNEDKASLSSISKIAANAIQTLEGNANNDRQ